ncbi:hypothetical protein [Kribbella catacumbae]|uniref:hypothetical protein n=1 Tax=Kribbella catacumbae TaxID=460086 RepID=UPI0003741D9F|nr:hypothetical protein [Kribbella catacumbae]
MKLTDLRDELTARANSTDETPDLLPGVRHKIARTKRRRTAGAAGAAGGLAIIAIVASGIVPGLSTTTPQPADDVPRDYTKDGVVLRGVDGADRLEKGWIGDTGQDKLTFSWTPEGKAVRFATYCNSTASSLRTVTIRVNDYIVGTNECLADPEASGDGIRVPTDHLLGLLAPAGKPARVTAQLSDALAQPVQDSSVQLALGIYQTAVAPSSGPPSQAPPTSADDYVKDGIRYRAKVGGDALLAAKIGDRGKTSFDLAFTAPGGRISLHDFCTARHTGVDPQYQVSIRFNGSAAIKTSCSGEGSIDAGANSSFIPGETPPAGQRVTVTVRLEDRNGKPLSKPDDWLGLGIYAKGKARAVGDSFVDVVKEFNGHNYRLAEVKTADARTARELELATPADKPFLVAYGTAGMAGDQPTVGVTGLTDSSSNVGGGIGIAGEAARPAFTAKLTLSPGKYTRGHLVLALYLPAD